MENTNQEYQNYLEARKKVTEIKGFYSHLITYVLVISLLIFINLKYSPEHIWFVWTAGGWGIGLLSHAAKVFRFFPVLGKDWEEKKIQEIMEEEKNKKL